MSLEELIKELRGIRFLNIKLRNNLEHVAPHRTLAFYDGVITTYNYIISRLSEETRKEKEKNGYLEP